MGTEIDFRQGRLTRTGRELDLAIEGQGFFQVKDPSGSIYYSRAGHFSRNSTGQIVVASAKSGRILEPAISIPADATAISISPAGVVSYRVPGNQTLTQAGTIQLGTFINSQGLMTIGENLYQETEGSGTCETGSPGCNSFGKVRQGWIEKSNVDLRQEASEWKRIREFAGSYAASWKGPRLLPLRPEPDFIAVPAEPRPDVRLFSQEDILGPNLRCFPMRWCEEPGKPETAETMRCLGVAQKRGPKEHLPNQRHPRGRR